MRCARRNAMPTQALLSLRWHSLSDTFNVLPSPSSASTLVMEVRCSDSTICLILPTFLPLYQAYPNDYAVCEDIRMLLALLHLMLRLLEKFSLDPFCAGDLRQAS